MSCLRRRNIGFKDELLTKDTTFREQGFLTFLTSKTSTKLTIGTHRETKTTKGPPIPSFLINPRQLNINDYD